MEITTPVAQNGRLQMLFVDCRYPNTSALGSQTLFGVASLVLCVQELSTYLCQTWPPTALQWPDCFFRAQWSIVPFRLWGRISRMGFICVSYLGTLGIGKAGAHIEIPDALRLRRDKEEGRRRSMYACWWPPPLTTAQCICLLYRDVMWGVEGIFPPNLYEKMYYVSVLSDTAVDVKIWHENTFQNIDFGEIDILVYKFGWIYSNLGVND